MQMKSQFYVIAHKALGSLSRKTTLPLPFIRASNSSMHVIRRLDPHAFQIPYIAMSSLSAAAAAAARRARRTRTAANMQHATTQAAAAAAAVLAAAKHHTAAKWPMACIAMEDRGTAAATSRFLRRVARRGRGAATMKKMERNEMVGDNRRGEGVGDV